MSRRTYGMKLNSFGKLYQVSYYMGQLSIISWPVGLVV